MTRRIAPLTPVIAAIALSLAIPSGAVAKPNIVPGEFSATKSTGNFNSASTRSTKRQEVLEQRRQARKEKRLKKRLSHRSN